MNSIPPRAHAARQRIMDKAAAMLARRKPFDVWAAGLTEEQREMFTRAAGSLEDAYWPLVREIERQAVDPMPNVVIETENGVSLSWE